MRLLDELKDWKSVFNRKAFIILILGTIVFLMMAINTGIAQRGWDQNIDMYKEKLDPWLFSFVGFSLDYGIVVGATIIILAYVFLIEPPKKGERNATPKMD